MAKEFFTRLKNNIKPHLWFLIILLVITLIHFSILFTTKMPYNPPDDPTVKGWQQHDNIFFYFPMLMRINQEIEEGNYYPLWNKYTLAGSPLMADPEVPIYTFPVFYMRLGINPYLSDNLGIMTHFLLAAIFMYIFIYLITKSREAAFIAALCYANGGYFVWDLIAGAYAFIQCMSVFPLVLICFYYIIFTDKYIMASLFSVLTLALAATLSPTVFVYFTVLVVALFIYFLIMSGNKSKMIKRYFICALIILPLTLGIVAYKAFPAKEYMELSERGGAGISFEEARRGIALKDLAIIDPLISVKNNRQEFRDVYIGLVPFILIIFALLFKFRNKWVIFLSLLTLVLVLASFGDKVFYLFYKFYPMMYNMRRPQRFLIIANLAANILVAFGYLAFYSKFGKRISTSISDKFRKTSSFLNKVTSNTLSIEEEHTQKSHFNWSFLIVTFLIILNLIVPGFVSGFGLNYVDMDEQISKNQVMSFISEQPGVFRMHAWEMRGQEYGMEHFTQPLKLQHLYGFVTVWEIDYMNIFMSYSFNNPARVWGMLNTKYVTAMTPINITGLNFVEKFEECPSCDPPKAAGPYLYENEEFLPRAYITKNAMLVYGKNKRTVQQLIHGLILASDFNPKNMVVISTNKAEDMRDSSFLSKFKGVFLTEMPPSEPVLKKYKDKGGKIFPDIFEGEGGITPGKMDGFLKSLNNDSEYYPLEDYSEYIPIHGDKMKIRLKEPKSGFLVMSEKFSYYPGWYFRSNGKYLDVLKASDVLTAVPIDNDQNIDIYYMPDSLRNTWWVSLIALIITVSLLVYLGIFRKKK